MGPSLLDSGSGLAKFKSDAVDIPKSTLEQYVGLYEMRPDFYITISKEGKQLFGRATGQESFGMFPENDTVFYLTVVEAKISFQLEKSAVESLTLFQGGHEMLGKKIE